MTHIWLIQTGRETRLHFLYHWKIQSEIPFSSNGYQLPIRNLFEFFLWEKFFFWLLRRNVKRFKINPSLCVFFILPIELLGISKLFQSNSIENSMWNFIVHFTAVRKIVLPYKNVASESGPFATMLKRVHTSRQTPSLSSGFAPLWKQCFVNTYYI